jgi:hypothetical protein
VDWKRLEEVWRPWAEAFSVALGFVAAAVMLAALVARVVPPWHLPWTPLDLDQPIGRATAGKIAALEDDPVRCLALLAEAGVEVEPVPDRRQGEFCVVENAVRIRAGVTPLRPAGLVLRCPHVASLVIWDRQVLRPAARELLGREATAIDTYGSYACRRVYGSATGRPSEHARANALDVAGVRLEGGGRVTVSADWNDSEATAEAAFLRRIRDGACRVFGAVLSPDYNAAHRDHLHLDRGPFRVCR